MKEPEIGTKSVRQHERVSAIIRRSGGRVTLAEAIDLLGIETVDGDGLLKQSKPSASDVWTATEFSGWQLIARRCLPVGRAAHNTV